MQIICYSPVPKRGARCPRVIGLLHGVTLPYIAVVVANAGRETILGKNAIIRETRKGISGNQKD